MEEIELDGKIYVASKKAAIESGYTQDYVGQLCRGNQIDARRVSGQWYVFVESLRDYKNNAATFKPEPPKYEPDPNVEASLNLEGKEYVSAALAAKLTDYNQDYVGQLARGAKIPSKQVGNRWYIEREALVSHKLEKDAMLRAVQAESVGLKRPEPRALASYIPPVFNKKPEPSIMVYRSDDKPLFPELYREEELKAVVTTQVEPPEIYPENKIAIRVVHADEQEISRPSNPRKSQTRSVSMSGKSIFNNLFPAITVTAVLAVVVGIGALNSSSIYTFLNRDTPETQTASVGVFGERIANYLEPILARELVYKR